MEPWWGDEWHASHEKLIHQQLIAVYLERFVCSKRNLIWMLSRQAASEPCQVDFNFKWLSQWGEPARIMVTAGCSCAEVFEIFFADLSDDGQIISDTIAPWKLPVAGAGAGVTGTGAAVATGPGGGAGAGAGSTGDAGPA